MVDELKKEEVPHGAVVIQHWTKSGPEGTFRKGFKVLSPNCEQPKRKITDPGMPLVIESFKYELLPVGQSTTVYTSFGGETVSNLGDVGGVTTQRNRWPIVRRFLGEPSVKRIKVIAAT